MGAKADAGLKIFVGGLNQDTTVEGLNAYFGQFGDANAYIMKDSATGRSRGFGFVNFQEESVVSFVLQFQHQIDGARISCSRYEATRSGGKGRDRVESSSRVLPQVQLPSRIKQEPEAIFSRLGDCGVERQASGEFKLFVNGLSPETTRDLLNAYFQQYDTNVDCYIMMDGATGRSRGFAFANFHSEVAVATVLKADHQVDGVPIRVSPYRAGGNGPSRKRSNIQAPPPRALDPLPSPLSSRSSRGGLPELTAPVFAGTGGDEIPSPELKVFVGGLSQDSNKATLNEYFRQFGDADSYVMKDGNTGRSRGFGFVNFTSEETMNQVLGHKHHIVDGVLINVSPYKGTGPPKPGPPIIRSRDLTSGIVGYGPVGGLAPKNVALAVAHKVVVSDLSKSASEDMLEEGFSPFEPTYVVICRDSQGRSRGFGIVEFATDRAAREACLYPPVIDGIQTDVSEYTEKECAGSTAPEPAPLSTVVRRVRPLVDPY